jgi:hypothetical protein
MKKTNIEIRAAWNCLSKLIQTPMKGSDAQHLALLSLKLQPILKTYEDTFKKILDKFGKKNEDGTYATINDGKDYDIIPESKEAFDVEVKELAESLIDIEWEKKRLGDVQISALEIMHLLDFICFAE